MKNSEKQRRNENLDHDTAGRNGGLEFESEKKRNNRNNKDREIRKTGEINISEKNRKKNK